MHWGTEHVYSFHLNFNVAAVNNNSHSQTVAIVAQCVIIRVCISLAASSNSRHSKNGYHATRLVSECRLWHSLGELLKTAYILHQSSLDVYRVSMMMFFWTYNLITCKCSLRAANRRCFWIDWMENHFIVTYDIYTYICLYNSTCV